MQTEPLAIAGLAGRRAIVTGAARGVGRSVAEALVGAGLEVCGVDIAPVVVDGCRFVHADLGDPEVGRKVTAEFPDADILVNAAGLLRPCEFEELTVSGFDEAIAVNLRSVFLLSQSVVGGMAERGFGRIVTYSSVNARTGGTTSAAYAAAKAGVIALSKSIARVYASKGVTVNVIAPAAIDTELNSFLTPEGRAGVEKQIPVGRFSTPEEQAAVALFLIGPGASYITGATLDVNGGWVMT